MSVNESGVCHGEVPMRRIVLLLTMTLASSQPPLGAQSAVPASAETKSDDLASLDGQVLDLSSGGPVRKAAVVMRRVDGRPAAGADVDFGTSTDESGKFAMKDLDPGRYRMTVSRSGYVNGEYGARGPGRHGAILSLDRAQKLTGLVVKLTPQGVVTGRIVDREGDPVSGAQVVLMRYFYQQGRKQLEPSAVGGTNDLGEYRIYGVTPGRYYLSARYRGIPALGQAADRSATPPSNDNYVPVYYPGTFDPSSAMEFAVTPGGQFRADLTLDKTRTSRIAGRVVSEVGDNPAANIDANVTLAPRGSSGLGFLFNNNAPVRNGKFEFLGVAPGSYSLFAVIRQAGQIYSTRVPIETNGADIDDLTLTVGAGLEIAGRVRMEADSAQSLAGLHVTIQSEGEVVGGLPSTVVEADGTFRLARVIPDVYTLAFPGLPAGLYVKSIRSGDLDLLATGLDLTNGGPATLDVVLSPNTGQIAGMVQDGPTQQPMAGATVVLIPEEKLRGRQSYYRTTTTDQSGGFLLSSIAPGEYKIYGWEDVETGAYLDPEFVQPFESQAQKISVHEKDELSLQLTAIPADANPARP